MVICVIWEGNLVAFPARGLNFDALKSRGLEEKHEIVIWKPSHYLLEDRNTLTTPVS
jgi:hypothetical protein